MVSNDTIIFFRRKILEHNENTRIESKLDVESYIQNLKYALKNGAEIKYQELRYVDEYRMEKHTNRFTIADLFPNENPIDALRRELMYLKAEDYIRTVKDLRFPKRSEMREFGKKYEGHGDVYIKIRVELLPSTGNHSAFVMSFHYAEFPFSDDMFPYKKE